MTHENQLFQKVISGIQFAEGLPPRPVYNLKNLEGHFSKSTKTAQRRIKSLVELGLAKYHRGNFQIKREVIAQPLNIFKKIFPSLLALQKAQRLGRSYNVSDINFVLNYLQDSSIVTLDHRAWDLTNYQYPNDLFIYVDDLEETVALLKKEGFSKGNKGHIVLLPKIGSFENEIERIYFDCIAKGGRSVMDAIALQLCYPEQITTRARFPIESIKKVQEDLPIKNDTSINR